VPLIACPILIANIKRYPIAGTGIELRQIAVQALLRAVLANHLSCCA